MSSGPLIDTERKPATCTTENILYTENNDMRSQPRVEVNDYPFICGFAVCVNGDHGMDRG